jgi:hypothetical protein
MSAIMVNQGMDAGEARGSGLEPGWFHGNHFDESALHGMDHFRDVASRVFNSLGKNAIGLLTQHIPADPSYAVHGLEAEQRTPQNHTVQP